MALFSMRTRRKLGGYALTALVVTSVYIIQTTIMNHFPVQGVYCNLPLTLVIIWGSVFGSPLPPISPDELRVSSVGQIFVRQMMSGSFAGALAGGLVAALYGPIINVFAIEFPLAGWFAGYFCLRNLNKQNLLCMPLVFVITLLAESVMAWQLYLTGRAGTIDHLMQIAMPEAILNTVIAPFIYFPMRRWYDFSQTKTVVREA